TYIIHIKYGKFVFDAESLKNLILNMSLFGGALIYNESLVLQIVWTLSIEVQFYIIAAMILSVTRGNVDKYIYYIIAFLMVAFIAISIHVLKMQDSPFKVYIGVGSSILPFMFVGTSICMLKKKAINKMQFTGLILLIILAISYAPYPIYFSLDKGLPSFILAVIVFCLCLDYKQMSNIMSKKPMLFLGRISYPLYAIHMSVLIFAYYSRDVIGGSGVFIEIVILSLIMAYIIHVTVESPIHAWSKRKVKNKYLLKS
uniref:acyltransferase family protein n=1 Tax=Yersinia hibernica TaxID=2339259 RepID=UPI00119F710A